MITSVQSPYTLWIHQGTPDLLESYAKKATLYDEIDVKDDAEGDWIFIGVSRETGSIFLAVLLRYSPSQGGFYPGILLVPETETLFIGAGKRILVYDLKTPRRVVRDDTDCGFWGWGLHGGVVVMSAELEIAAWSHDGTQKLWSHFADPPWTYEVAGTHVILKTCSFQKNFDLYAGPS